MLSFDQWTNHVAQNLTFCSTSNVFLQLKNERKSEQAHIPHAPTLPENAVNNEWQFSISDGKSDRKPASSGLHKKILAKVQKGYKLILNKDQISISCKNAYLQITCMSFITTKFHEILLSGLSGFVLTICFE